MIIIIATISQRYVVQFVSALTVFCVIDVLCVSGSGDQGCGERMSVILGEGCY